MHVHRHAHICINVIYTWWNTYHTHVCMDTHTNTHTHAYTHARTHTRMHARTHTHTHRDRENHVDSFISTTTSKCEKGKCYRLEYKSFLISLQDGKNLLQLAMSQNDNRPEIVNCCRIIHEYRNTSVSCIPIYLFVTSPLLLWVALSFRSTETQA